MSAGKRGPDSVDADEGERGAGGGGGGGGTNGVLIKRQRQESPPRQELIVATDAQGKGLIQSVRRTSGLTAPIMCLSGHQGEILDVAFDPTGDCIASCSTDKTISLWKTYGECENYGVLRPPSTKSAITSVMFSPFYPGQSNHLFASSADKSLYSFDLVSGKMIRRHKGHNGVVNDVDAVRGGAGGAGAGRETLVSGSDDGTVRIWRLDERDAVDEIQLGYPVTAAKWSDDGQQVFVGGVDNDIHVFDLRKKEVVYSLRGHTDTISSLAVSPSGSHILSTSFDSTCKIWDVRPFAPTVNTAVPGASPRLYRTLAGSSAGFEGWLRRAAWDKNGERVAIGGADRNVTIWNVESTRIEFQLPGHKGTVTSVDFHPVEPVIVSGSIDRQIYLGEIEPVPR